MKKSDFRFELPRERIAQEPLEKRAASRLLAVDRDGSYRDVVFKEIVRLLRRGDVLVFNDTRVLCARLHGVKESGGAVELLIERFLGGASALTRIRASKPPRAGSLLHLTGDVKARVVERQGEFYRVEFLTPEPLLALLDRIGHVPLPPYIERADRAADRERYQTVYNRVPGAVAAPTAGLHFDPDLMLRLDEMGIESVFVTLHVGAGTFQPMRVENIEAHRMHSEWYRVSEEAASKINSALIDGRRIVAVGTTVVRVLETVASGKSVRAGEGETEIFIFPGYRFRIVNALITNFHLPESTLLMLVCAFGGTDRVLGAYRHAVQERYRFFSYGDAMFLERSGQD